MARDLTDRQKDILDFIAYECERGVPPSIREIGREFAINQPNGVRDHLLALQRKGYIKIGGFKSRHITIVYEPGTSPSDIRTAIASARYVARHTPGQEDDPFWSLPAAELIARLAAERISGCKQGCVCGASDENADEILKRAGLAPRAAAAGVD